MNLSYKWLKELVNFKERPEKLADILSAHTAEVEKVIRLDKRLDNIVVAEIEEIKPHPRADRLKVVMVRTKLRKKTKELQIVCGAKNIKVGQKVPLSLPGAFILGQEIKESVIRGVKSEGMLCAEDELGIGPDHSGIYILPDEAKLGQPISKVLGLDDTVLEVENHTIAHRPDLFSHFGFVWEIAALTNSKIKAKTPKFYIKSSKTKRSSRQIKIAVQDKKLCPRYMAVVMENIRVGPSPLWMQNRLRNLGIRPINNVVDITNYVMLEFGQPLHAFDIRKLENKQIIVRRAKQGEKILALDGREYELSEEDLIIADSSKPIALAGIMGGEETGVNEDTETIVIESANFNPSNIRRSSQRLGIRTEASLRFEKGLPLCFAAQGITRAIELAEELAGGRRCSQIFDIKSRLAETKLSQSKRISLDIERLNSIVGYNFKEKDVVKVLDLLQFKPKIKQRKIAVTVPVFREDVNLEEDIVEEIVRIYGIDKIVPRPIVGEIVPPQINQGLVLEKKIRNVLVGAGFDEVCNYIFCKEKTGGGIDYIKIANPLNPYQQYLRVSLLPGLEKSTEKNQKFFDEFRIFEIGDVFWKINNKIFEKKRVGGAIYEKNNLFFKVKGVVEQICQICNIDKDRLDYKFFSEIKPREWIFLPSSQVEAVVLLDKDVLGVLGELDKGKFKIGFFEIDFDLLVKRRGEEKRYQPISRYEPIKRDLAFLIDRKIPCKEVEKAIKGADSLIKSVELFDVFEDKKFGWRRNLAFHIIYQSSERTLTTEEIEVVEKKICRILKEKFGAQLRNF